LRYPALACDYDGTLAQDGRVDQRVIDSLKRFRASGGKLVLITGRRVEDLLQVYPKAQLFDRIVAENGAVLHSPLERWTRSLAKPPPRPFVDALRNRGVNPLSTGRVIVATLEPQTDTVLQVIRDFGREFQVIRNKGAVMVLPVGVDKATGLEAALLDMGLSRHDTVGIGDAENDLAFLDRCGFAVAVANALPMVKASADVVTRGEHGLGVMELIDQTLLTG
jgi:hydroxymethylpyrimidine pyrophosphatase-like HAD family hydrolase